MCDKHFVYHIE